MGINLLGPESYTQKTILVLTKQWKNTIKKNRNSNPETRTVILL